MSNFEEIFTFPFQTAESRKNFLIGCLVALAAFFIPILPYLAMQGYAARIARQIMSGEKPTMPAWDENPSELLVNGLRIYGIKLIYSLPAMIPLFLGMFIYFGGFFFIAITDDPQALNTFLPILMLIFFAMICLAIPLGLASSMLGYPASMHTIAHGEFAAGFRFGEWWPILRANLGGFLLVIGVSFILSFVLNIVMQIMMFTIILICLLPVLIPIFTFYMVLILDLTAARAYRDGQTKLSTTPAREA